MGRTSELNKRFESPGFLTNGSIITVAISMSSQISQGPSRLKIYANKIYKKKIEFELFKHKLNHVMHNEYKYSLCPKLRVRNIPFQEYPKFTFLLIFTCSCTPSYLQLRASITKACTPPTTATSILHLSSAAKFARAPAERSCKKIK